VWLGVAGGGLAAGLAALRGLPTSFGAAPTPRDPRRAPAIRLAAVGLAALLAMLGPVDAWPVLLGAFGMAASTCAPAAVFACWRERAGATGLGAGAGVGLAAFLALTAIHLASGGGTADRSWLGWLAAWPALVAAPLNALTAWLLPSGSRPSPRAPLPPGLAELHG
jgi:Na+(H+)/acetate symporter ActP